MSDAMSAEFDTVAEWTAQVCTRLGADYYLPAACRGSGSPQALDWLITGVGAVPGATLLDAGAGVGGPAAYAVHTSSVHPVLVEPEAGACRAALRLFGFPVVQGSGSALPVADGVIDAAWSLGVLCTMADQLGLLTELRRVVRPGGGIGLLVFIATRDITADEQPEGNEFPTEESLHRLFDRAGLTVLEEQIAAELGASPDDWERRADEVEAQMAARYGEDDAWKAARRQSERMGVLLGDGAVVGTLFTLRAS
ncbi:methyltransferase domain-containing protein [Mycobacterium sp. SMC-4]|uniref:methyltransferase domain-containing protein n=1 Tax=Mycobacterium sp. SMC-4 TaxID=2857059 RepID=UPI0021B38249|nr:methyltransferase domain-containing protein [Mycobacterium sp. SMC-4]UXA20046.1 methyltransferase domain-containing protein [Mycobacterium sp. SMC-4]